MGYHIITKKETLTGQYPDGTQGTYLVVESEAEIIRTLFHKAAAGASLSGLTRWLNESGVPTRQPNIKKKGNNDGEAKFWRVVTVRTILKNPVYKGEVLVGRKEVITDESRREAGLKTSYYLRDRKPEDCVSIKAPALVSAEIWQQVQDRLADNQARMSGRKGRRFVLSGLWRCPECRNRGGVAHKQGENHGYYCREKRTCHSPTYGGKIAEQAVYNVLKTMVQSPELMETALQTYANRDKKSDSVFTRTTLLKELSNLQEREKATIKAQIADVQAGADPAMYEEAFNEIAARRKELQQKLAGLEVQEAPASTPKDTETMFETIIADLETALEDELLEPAEKNAPLSTVVQGVFPLNREGDYRVDFCPLPGSGLTVHQTLSRCQPVGLPKGGL